jgi:CopG family transcriptional regulator, nickel-responsive regulator
MADLHRFSFSIEKPLADKLGKMIRESHYENRSEFIRDLVRGKMVAEKWEMDGEALGTISLLYDHHKRRLSEKLIEVQHHHAAQVLASTHVHLDERICAEMIMARGKAGDIRHLFDHMRQEKGVLHASISLGSLGSELG